MVSTALSLICSQYLYPNLGRISATKSEANKLFVARVTSESGQTEHDPWGRFSALTNGKTASTLVFEKFSADN